MIAFGFRDVGVWRLDSALKSGVRFSITTYADERVIYAFAVDDTTKYVGVCDTSNTTLRSRLSRYQGMAGAGTNKRVAELIKTELDSRRSVRILAWLPGEEFQVGGLAIDLVKGLENPLIQAVNPEWNIHR